MIAVDESAVRAFLGIDDEWEIRFIADEHRARRLAADYRRAGFDVRYHSITDDGTDCSTCLEESVVVVTRRADSGSSSSDASTSADSRLVYD